MRPVALATINGCFMKVLCRDEAGRIVWERGAELLARAGRGQGGVVPHLPDLRRRRCFREAADLRFADRGADRAQGMIVLKSRSAIAEGAAVQVHAGFGLAKRGHLGGAASHADRQDHLTGLIQSEDGWSA